MYRFCEEREKADFRKHVLTSIPRMHTVIYSFNEVPNGLEADIRPEVICIVTQKDKVMASKYPQISGLGSRTVITSESCGTAFYNIKTEI